MVGENNQNVFLIQIDASNFSEFEIAEFEISRFDCILPCFAIFKNVAHSLELGETLSYSASDQAPNNVQLS